jgi:hypothetical protein
MYVILQVSHTIALSEPTPHTHTHTRARTCARMRTHSCSGYHCCCVLHVVEEIVEHHAHINNVAESVGSTLIMRLVLGLA